VTRPANAYRIIRRAKGLTRAKVALDARGADVGARPQIDGRLIVRRQGQLRIGHHLMVDGFPLPTKFTVGAAGNLQIGDHCFFNFGVDLNCQRSIIIGDWAKVAPLVSIIDDDMHELLPGQRRIAAIHIGKNVWIGRGVTIGPGVTIGDHAVIGANSVVTRDLPPKSVAVGSPAKIIRELDVPDDWVRL
jgi:acetyltransferase-like isoleucine patch superfamily enzyme